MAKLQCERCFLEFPVTSFPDFDSGLVCESCRAGEDAANAHAKLIEKTKSMADQLLEIDDIGSALPKIRDTLGAIYQKFGGPNAFAGKVVWMIDELCKRRPIPASAAQMMINLMKLHFTVEQGENQIRAQDLTDEQIRREQEIALAQLAMEALGDPAKRKVLQDMFGRQGIALIDLPPEEHREIVVQQVKEAASG